MSLNVDFIRFALIINCQLSIINYLHIRHKSKKMMIKKDIFMILCKFVYYQCLLLR